MTAPLVILGSFNCAAHLPLGMDIMRTGGSALDAVERIIREVESDTREHTVGTGGWPNLVGEVELDASIMSGRDRRTGAVGALRRYAHPISVARKVMELTPHVMLVGQGAEDFAREAGFPEETVLTSEASEEWSARLRENVPPADMPDLLGRRKLLPFVLLARDPQRVHGTVNVIARDGHDDMVTGVSTSGWAWKYPGRLGDSPIIGAGNYCDNRFGAAACAGHGETAIRGSLARTVVMHMEYGRNVEEACALALRDAPVPGAAEDAAAEEAVLVIVAMDREGRPGCFTNSGHGWGCAYMTEAMTAAQSRPSQRVPPA